MTLEIIVPELGESVTEATVAKWFKAPGDAVALDEPLVELETDKVALEVNAASAGVLTDIIVSAGEDVAVGAVLGHLAEGTGAVKAAVKDAVKATEISAAAPKAVTPDAMPAAPPAAPPVLSPAVRKLIEESGLDANEVQGSGKDGRILKGDVLELIAAPGAPEAPQTAETAETAKIAAPATAAAGSAREERVPMSRLRRRVAERLKEAQNTAAMLTTFNEADMSHVMAARAEYRDAFEKKHGVRLGFMSFFVKAAIAALKDIPAVNAEIDGADIVYKKYYHIGVAVSAPQGLVVPVLRDADQLGFAEIEKRIAALGVKARDGKLSMDDLSGGTFTISNGGVFGSLMSTPILNPPQSGILGMHKIQERPIAIDGEIHIRPMMYLALSYDHRLIDGSEAVTFLVRVKECIEAPERLLLDL
ncbi:MAG: 2-oxoglutarate dehydrogenase complex dihydrolipoyllysine-residue succinyltransferase [Proteobacteria bacterium]|nr:2-oxoglutarate dehydrogenase complex dihydrolipoyllysine-residue succinyltransferase [Pseudomonadota bacterium]